jgi:hypothetical protein
MFIIKILKNFMIYIRLDHYYPLCQLFYREVSGISIEILNSLSLFFATIN